MPKVTFLNEVITVEADKGKSVLQVAEQAGVNVFEGFWANYHCPGIGLCPGVGCKVWVTELEKDATSPRTRREKIRPSHRGTIRLACQALVLGDVEVRTQPGALLDNVPKMKWDPDERHWRWKDRLAAKGGAAADDEDKDESEEA